MVTVIRATVLYSDKLSAGFAVKALVLRSVIGYYSLIFGFSVDILYGFVCASASVHISVLFWLSKTAGVFQPAAVKFKLYGHYLVSLVSVFSVNAKLLVLTLFKELFSYLSEHSLA